MACLQAASASSRCDLAALEVALEQRVVGGRNRFEQLGAPQLGFVLKLGRNLGFVILAGCSAALEDVRLPVNRLTMPLNFSPSPIGSSAGRTLWA